MTRAGVAAVLLALVLAPRPGVVITSGTVSTVARGLTTVSLLATAATGGTAPYTYQWYRSTTHGFTPGAGNVLGGQTALQVDDTGLTRGTAYYYQLVSTDAVAATVTSVEMSVRVLYLVACDGDSLTAADKSNYPLYLLDLLPNAAIVNTGISSNRIAYMVTGGPDPFFASSVRTDPSFTAAIPSVLVFWAGTNDLVIGDTDTTIYTNEVAYARQRLAVGWKVVVLTILPRVASQFTAPVIAYQNSINTSMRAAYHDWGHGLADVRANALIGDDGDQTDTTYYENDQIHLKAAGATIVAGIVAQAVRGVIGPQAIGVAIR